MSDGARVTTALSFLRDDLRISVAQIAQETGSSPRTVERWLKGDTRPVSAAHKTNLIQMAIRSGCDRLNRAA